MYFRIVSLKHIFLLTNVTPKNQLKKVNEYIGKLKEKHLLNGLFPLLSGFLKFLLEHLEYHWSYTFII